MELRSDLWEAGVGRRMCGLAMARSSGACSAREGKRRKEERRRETSLPRRIPRRCILTCRFHVDFLVERFVLGPGYCHFAGLNLL